MLASLAPWGAAHIVLSGENRVTGDLGGASLLLTGSGSLTAEGQSGIWGWGAVHAPVVAVLDGTSVTVQWLTTLFLGSQRLCGGRGVPRCQGCPT